MKKIITLILVLLLSFSAQAQLYGNKWRVGLSMGTTNYVGDIRPMPLREFKNLTNLYKRYETYAEQFSYQGSLEYALGNSVGLMLTAGSYQFGSADRFIQNDGTLLMESPSFDRALNFQTNLYDAGLSLVFKPDNNWLLSGKSFLAPYFTLGIGVQTFDVSGDLLDANGNRYDYTNQNTIPDGTFETDLASLRTEQADGYDQTTLYANLGLGVRFRITKSIEIFAQSDFKIAGTDYLDDVSGEYRTRYNNDFQQYAAKPGTNIVNAENRNRGFNDGNRDWYIYHGVGLKFSFGANKSAFKPPVITQRYTYVPNELIKKQLEPKPQENTTPKETETTNNYFTVVQLPEIEPKTITRLKLDSTQLSKNQILIDSLNLKGSEFNADLVKAEAELDSIAESMVITANDTSISDSTQTRKLQELENEKSFLEGKMTSISFLMNSNKLKVDSLMTESKQVETVELPLDSAKMIRELIIYPGQVSRILYSTNSREILQSDNTNQIEARSNSLDSTTSKKSETTNAEPKTSESKNSDPKNTETMSRKELESEMAKFKSEILQAQTKRDSALIMTLANRLQAVEEKIIVQSNQDDSQRRIITQEELDSRTAREVERLEAREKRAQEAAEKRQEKIDKRYNELLKDALLVGGTAAATTAITSEKNAKQVPVDSAKISSGDLVDSTLLASNQKSELPDTTNTSTPVIAPPIAPILSETAIRVDTVFVENENEALIRQAKIEVYFDINKATLSESEISKLAPIKDLLDRNPDENLELIGFADNTGSISYNLALTEKRVESVKKILMETYQIPAERIKTGDGGLIVRGKKSGSQDKDRKVEIRLTVK